ATCRLRMVVWYDALAEQRLYDRSVESFRDFDHLVAGIDCSASCKNRDLLAGVEDVRRGIQFLFSCDVRALSHEISGMPRHVPLRTLRARHGHRLHVDGYRQMRHASIGQRRAASELGGGTYMRRPHDPSIVDGDVLEKLVEVDVLLCLRVDEVMIGQPGDGEDWLSVELGIVKTVQQMDAARARGREAHAELAREFGIAAGHESCCFFVADLNEFDLVLLLPESLDDAVDAIPRHSEYVSDVPIDQGLDQHVCRRCSHRSLPDVERGMRAPAAPMLRAHGINWCCKSIVPGCTREQSSRNLSAR